MQRNKYVDDLGIPVKKYGTNFVPNDDGRHSKWEQEREIYSFDERETWNLDTTLAEWLYSHLMMYKEVNDVDLSEPTYEFKEKIYTLEEAIDLIIETMRRYLLAKIYSNEWRELHLYIIDAMTLLGMIFPALWW